MLESVNLEGIEELRRLDSADRMRDAAWTPLIPPSPLKLAEAAFHGLAGKIVRAIEPHSEADPAGLLVQLLVAFGSVIGRSAHFMVESSRHGTNLFLVLVGTTSNGRKGTGWNRIAALFESVDPGWRDNRVRKGLSSGEGVIWNVRDPIESSKPDHETGRCEVIDQGETDKRLFVIEEEYASMLKVMGREGNTLSPVVREAWDSGKLATMTKNSPARATDAHISIVGHVTQAELRKNFSDVEAANGFGNRFLWLEVKRSKSLPHGGALSEAEIAALGSEIETRVRFARTVGRLERSPEANALWTSLYEDLTAARHGLFGAITARGAPIVLRLSLLYALLDSSRRIEVAHLEAAKGVWDYADASTRRIFGDGLGDPVADEICQMLKGSPKGMTRNDLRDAFGRNLKRGELERALGVLVEGGLAVHKAETDTGGRPAERWSLVKRCVDTAFPRNPVDMGQLK